MKHLDQVLDYLDRDLTGSQHDQLITYRDWLISEALPAGGIGPGESGRIEQRHILDSLLFSRFLGQPDLIRDLGTGVGLPGIPLAVLIPSAQVELVDRSQRRLDLVKRVSRMLGLDNVTVARADIKDDFAPVPAVVSRASLSPELLLPVVRRHLRTEGIAVVGGSWEHPPHHTGWDTEEIPAYVLDRPLWLLIMRQQ